MNTEVRLATELEAGARAVAERSAYTIIRGDGIGKVRTERDGDTVRVTFWCGPRDEEALAAFEAFVRETHPDIAEIVSTREG